MSTCDLAALGEKLKELAEANNKVLRDAFLEENAEILEMLKFATAKTDLCVIGYATEDIPAGTLVDYDGERGRISIHRKKEAWFTVNETLANLMGSVTEEQLISGIKSGTVKAKEIDGKLMISGDTEFRAVVDGP